MPSEALASIQRHMPSETLAGHPMLHRSSRGSRGENPQVRRHDIARVPTVSEILFLRGPKLRSKAARWSLLHPTSRENGDDDRRFARVPVVKSSFTTQIGARSLFFKSLLHKKCFYDLVSQEEEKQQSQQILSRRRYQRLK
jgi:hypothetical protein